MGLSKDVHLLLLLITTVNGMCMGDPSLQLEYENMDPPVMPNQWHIHDPSKIVNVDGYLMIGVSGKENAEGYRCGLETWYISPGSEKWTPGQCLLVEKPGWVMEEVPNNGGAYWAPAMMDSRVMYYSVSDDNGATCIGKLTSSGHAPNLRWIDSGTPVTCSFNAEDDDEHDAPSSIDPAILVLDDKQFLIYGGGHIWITEINPNTGQQIEENWWEPDDATYTHLANGPWPPPQGDERTWIEAAYMHKHANYFYLFVNWYGCCNGVKSTYEIHMGRSASAFGPFKDKKGRNMKDGHGTLLLSTQGKFIGPGHASVFNATGNDWFSFHYYDGEKNGLPWIETREMVWQENENEGLWPIITEVSFNSAHYWE